MKYIGAEKLVRVEKVVLESILEWWKPELGDLAESTSKAEVWCLNSIVQVQRASDAPSFGKYVIPLLTVGQLIEFIEAKSGTKVCIRHSNEHIYFDLTDVSSDETLVIYTYEHFELLDGLWELAKQVIKLKISREH